MITAYSVSGDVVRVRTLDCVILYGFFPVINYQTRGLDLGLVADLNVSSTSLQGF